MRFHFDIKLIKYHSLCCWHTFVSVQTLLVLTAKVSNIGLLEVQHLVTAHSGTFGESVG
jgi:hypothetical protein